jgi:hypothetical protein
MEGFDPKQESKGLGDTIAKVTNFFGIDKVAEAVAKLAGAEGCGCNERREALNALFPYEGKTRKFKVLKQFNWEGVSYFEGQEITIDNKHHLFSGILALATNEIIEEI